MYLIRRTTSRNILKAETSTSAVAAVDTPPAPDPATQSPPPGSHNQDLSTSSSSSAALTLSIPLTSTSPSFPTLHTCIPQDADQSIVLRLHSRAHEASQTPAFHVGDKISGDIVVRLPAKDLQYVTSVELELQGESFAIGTTTYPFLSRKVDLWKSNGHPGPVVTTPLDNNTFSGTEVPAGANHGRSISSSPPSSFKSQAIGVLRRSASSASALFMLLDRSQSGGRNLRKVPGRTNSILQSRPRNQLEASGAHVWPFEIKLPRTISFSQVTDKDISRSRDHLTSNLEFSPTSPAEAAEQIYEEEKGGVRAEVTGYGVGWNEYSFSGLSKSAPFRNAEPPTLNNGLETAVEIQQQHQVTPRPSVDILNADFRPPESPGDGMRRFHLPPSFVESAIAAFLEYRLVVTVKMRGAFRNNIVFQQQLVVQRRSYADAIPRSVTPGSNESFFPSPEMRPDGWKFMPEVVMQVQLKKYQASMTANMDFKLKLAIARPLSYARGTSIPVRITISIPHPSTVSIKPRRGKILQNFASTPSAGQSFMPHSPTFTIASPTTPISPSSDDTAVAAISLVPTVRAVAASIRLVRAVCVGEGATDDSPGISSVSFSKSVAHAMILNNDDEPAESTTAAAASRSEEYVDGWTLQRGYLVRSYDGEIPLNDDLDASFEFPRFVLRYAVVLYPFEGSTFRPSSTQPLWSETVKITTDPANTGMNSNNSP